MYTSGIPVFRYSRAGRYGEKFFLIVLPIVDFKYLPFMFNSLLVTILNGSMIFFVLVTSSFTYAQTKDIPTRLSG